MSLRSEQRFFLILGILILAVSISLYMDGSLLVSPSSYANTQRYDAKVSVENRVYVKQHNRTNERFIVHHQLEYSTCTDNNNKAPDNWCLDTTFRKPHYIANEEWPPRKVHYYTL